MIAKIKSNKIVVCILFFVCLVLVINPKIYANCCLNAISVWAFSVLPTLLPFFILTRIIISLITPKQNFADKFFKKMYNTPATTSIVWLLSVISGYPMGAKLICNLYENKQISSSQAKKMLAICSVSGPMFIVGTIGVSFLCSFKAGIIILLCNVFAGLLNGFIYRGKACKQLTINVQKQNNSNILQNSVYDALVSVLMVGAYIVLSFIIIELLTNLQIISSFCKIFCNTTGINQMVTESFVKGLIEITRGTLDLGKCKIPLKIKTILCSGLVAFGGASVMMQSANFLAKINIDFKTMFLQKLTQCLICFAITTPIALFLL